MTDAQSKAIQKKVEKYIGLWRGRLWLHYWHVQTCFHRHGLESGLQGDTADAEPIMSITPDWRYMTATVHVNTLYIHEQDMDDESIERSVVHELMHCLLCEMDTEVPDEAEIRHRNHVERTTSILTNIVYHAYSGVA